MKERIVSASADYGYEAMQADIDELCRKYPFARRDIVGRSVQGRELVAVTIGDGGYNVHMNAAFHANEWITSLLLLSFLEDYAEAVSAGGYLSEFTGDDLFRHATLHAVPMVNPDGVELVQRGVAPETGQAGLLLQMNGGSDDFSAWKANIRGVDLNDQFPAFWEEERRRRSPDGPGPRDYVGPQPLSEPEAAAMAACAADLRFDCVLALHTQGREIYWNYRDYEPPEALRLCELLAEASGYKAVKLTDSDAGFKDWFIEQFRKPGFTVEAGYGVNPLPVSGFPAMYQEVVPILERCLMLPRL